MYAKPIRQVFFSIVFGIFLIAILIVYLGTAQQNAHAASSTLFVKVSGSGSTCSQAAPCSLSTALSNAMDGDMVMIAGGTYTGSSTTVITITKDVKLYGGWNGVPSGSVVRDVSAFPTKIDGEGQRQCVVVDDNAAPELNGLVIQRGSTDFKGGGIYVLEGFPVISHCVITGNHADQYGGGFYLFDGQTTILSSEILSNSTTNGGGGLNFAYGTSGTIQGNLIEDNYASYGSALEVDTSVVTLIGNRILNNRGNSAIIVSGSTSNQFTATNNLVANNQGCGIEINQYNARLLHNTIDTNGPYGIIGNYSATITMTNNIVSGHTAYSMNTYHGATITADHTLFWNNATNPILGANYVNSDPLFQNAAGNDYHLQTNSPAVNAGTSAGVCQDIEGKLRDRYPDLGAYEFGQYIYLPFVEKNTGP